MSKDPNKPPENEIAKAVNNLTKLLILLVAAALVAWAYSARMDSFDKAKDEGTKKATEFCIENAIEHNIGTDYCYDEP
jgi:hypothetical protein